MRALVLLVLTFAAGIAAAQSPDTDLAAYRTLFSPGSLGVAEPAPNLAAGWTLMYRGTVPHSAFALARAGDGRTVWNFASGRPSPEAARERALELCTRNAASIGGPPCRILAVDGTVEGRPALTPRTETIGPLRASPLHFWHGPARAEGIVIFSHGRGARREDLRDTPVQGWVSRLNDAGWDILRFDREPVSDEISTSLARLLAALPELRRRGYRRIVLAGQSRGGWHSLLAAAEQPELIDAVVATAPATHGSSALGQGAALDDWRRAVTALPADRPRIAVALFREDAFDPLPSARIERLETQAQRRRAPTLIIAPAAGPADHGAGASWQFTQDWGGCLLAFVREASPPTGTLRQDCGRIR